MHAVNFEVWPTDEGRQGYLDIAAALKPRLEQMDGFISIERFESLSEKGKILSLSFWRDDAAIAGWRQVERHRMAQAKGRALLAARELFLDDQPIAIGQRQRARVGRHKAAHPRPLIARVARASRSIACPRSGSTRSQAASRTAAIMTIFQPSGGASIKSRLMMVSTMLAMRAGLDCTSWYETKGSCLRS